MRIMLPLLYNAILPFCAAARTDTSDFSAPRGSRHCGDMWIHRISCCTEEQATRTRVLPSGLLLWIDGGRDPARKASRPEPDAISSDARSASTCVASVCAEPCTVCAGTGCIDTEVCTRSACTVCARALVGAKGVTSVFALCFGGCANRCIAGVCV